MLVVLRGPAQLLTGMQPPYESRDSPRAELSPVFESRWPGCWRTVMALGEVLLRVLAMLLLGVATLALITPAEWTSKVQKLCPAPPGSALAGSAATSGHRRPVVMHGYTLLNAPCTGCEKHHPKRFVLHVRGCRMLCAEHAECVGWVHNSINECYLKVPDEW
jgi:hypothetical protein